MITLGTQTCHQIGELSEISSARRAGSELSRKIGFDSVRSGELAIIITEACTNISKHAKSGCIFLRPISSGENLGIEIIAMDSGPGMLNVETNFEDGNSSTGTSGTGLGAIKRLAHFIDIYTELGKGTVLLMVLWANPESVQTNYWQIGSICIPIPSEEVCGDSWTATPSSTGLSLLIADGLGHGLEAARASLLAVDAVEADPELFPNRVLHNSHSLMKGYRGAAVAVARIDIHARELRYCGVGNIAGCIYTGEKRQHLLSHNGIVGTNMRKTHEFIHEWTNDSIVIMHSDGIGTKWSLENYIGLDKCHSSIIAAVIHRDSSRGRDDSTIVVLKRA